jgi:hypothetical protein
MLGMDDNAPKPAKPDVEERIGELREGITDADATGMIAGEELITQAETVLPLLRLQPDLPHEDLHAALPQAHAAHAAIDELHAEISKPTPNPQSIERHVRHLGGLPELEAIVANWWNDPRTQRFFSDLGQIGV